MSSLPMEGPRSAMLSLYLSFEFIHSIPLVLSFSRGFAINQILWGQICEKSFIYLEGNVPSLGNHFSGLFVPATPSSLSRTLEGLLELTQCPSRALVAVCVASGATEIQGHRQVFRDPSTPSRISGPPFLAPPDRDRTYWPTGSEETSSKPLKQGRTCRSS